MRTAEHFVKLYFSLSFTNKELLHLWHISNTLSSVSVSERISKKLLLFRRKNHRALEEITSFFVLKQILENLCLYCHKCINLFSKCPFLLIVTYYSILSSRASLHYVFCTSSFLLLFRLCCLLVVDGRVGSTWHIMATTLPHTAHINALQLFCGTHFTLESHYLHRRKPNKNEKWYVWSEGVRSDLIVWI